MTRRHKLTFAAATVALMLPVAATGQAPSPQASPAATTPSPSAEPTEFLIGPISQDQDVNGTMVRVTVNNYFKVVSKKEGLSLESRLEVDLSDLQQKFPEILGAMPLPKDNCGSYKLDNLVVSLPNRDLRAEGDHALMAIGGKVDIWSCFENPIPNTKIEWQVKNIGFGIKTKVPVLITWPGSPIKNKTASQPFDATLPIYFRKLDDRTIGIVLGQPSVNLKGQYVFITKGILSLANIDVNEEARKAINKAIAPDSLLKAIPEEFSAMNPIVKDATFYNQGGQLAARINVSATIPPEKITEWISLMLKKPENAKP
ncbi:MAG: hypothetical protein WC729_03910 [Sphingomonas sp.]|jgi:hypothetical protein|uniref:hypothetical protein n=1 Tax=Sphingomonas sp. TaxID=28214 RepID=UPI0035681E93